MEENGKKETKKENKKGSPAGGIMMAVMFVACAAGGYFGMSFADKALDGMETKEKLITMAAALLMFYLVIFIQTVLHEGGHLIFGLLTGYSFESFRIGSFMIKKENDRLKLCRFSLAGTGGQCLMCPPDFNDGKLPFVWYNFGGAIVNLISATISYILYICVDGNKFLALFFILNAIVGILFAAMNGIPVHTKLIDNDGYNAISLGKNKEALYAWYASLKINEQAAKGIRLKDMSEELFIIADESNWNNSIAVSSVVFFCNRLMDMKEFEKAYEMMDKVLKADTAMPGIYANLLKLDCMYCEMTGENRKEVIEELYTKELKAFTESMKKFPSVLRTQYTYELLVNKDEKKAEDFMKKFEAMAKKYPNKADIDSELELMELALKEA